MGRLENYDNLEDFIIAAKANDIKIIFFTLRQSSKRVMVMKDNAPVEASQTTAEIMISATSRDGKTHLAHTSTAAEISSDGLTQEIVDSYENKCKTGLSEAVKSIQKDYPSADVKAGFCAPTEA